MATAVSTMERAVAIAGALFLAASGCLAAGSWSLHGAFGGEARLFRDDRDATTADRPLAVLARLELRHRHGRWEERLRGFGRFDPRDSERRRLVPEEAWVQTEGARVRWRFGLDLVNWSALEAFHPADVINARNLESDVENLEKIGEPMAAGHVQLGESTSLDVLLLPVYTETRLASTRSRLGGNFVRALGLRGRRQLVDRGGELTTADFGPQLALQLRRVLGPADLTIGWVEHMDRLQPVVRVDARDGRPTLLYQTTREVVGTYQRALGSSVLKAEGAYLWFVTPGRSVTARFGGLDGRDRGTLAAGVEHGFHTAGAWSSTLLLEAQAVLGDQRALGAFDVFRRGAFVGWRAAANDVAGMQLLVGAIFDPGSPTDHLLLASYEQRLRERWTLEAALRVFSAAAKGGSTSGLALLRDADHLRLVLERHF